MQDQAPSGESETQEQLKPSQTLLFILAVGHLEAGWPEEIPSSLGNLMESQVGEHALGRTREGENRTPANEAM